MAAVTDNLTHSDLDDFTDNLLSYFIGEQAEQAGRSLTRYLIDEPFTGRWFEAMADSDHPNEITERDLTAVTMLGVNVPAPCAIWLLNDGRRAVSELLSELPPEADMWEVGDEVFEVAEQLWELLNTAGWPDPGSRANNMGRTIKSKLLAAKRPRLLPVLDTVVCGALGERDDFWGAFRYALGSPEHRLVTTVRCIPHGDLSLLRCIDVVIWMAERHPNDARPG